MCVICAFKFSTQKNIGPVTHHYGVCRVVSAYVRKCTQDITTVRLRSCKRRDRNITKKSVSASSWNVQSNPKRCRRYLPSVSVPRSRKNKHFYRGHSTISGCLGEELSPRRLRCPLPPPPPQTRFLCVYRSFFFYLLSLLINVDEQRWVVKT